MPDEASTCVACHSASAAASAGVVSALAPLTHAYDKAIARCSAWPR